MHMIDLVKRLAELDAGNPNVIKEESGTVSCSSCGDKFKIAGRKDGFSHCKDHAGHKALDESVSLEECGPMGMMTGGMDHHTPASINITADSGDELSTMLRDIMTLAGRGHAEPDADNMPVDAVAVDMAPPAEVSMDGGDDENGLMRSMMDKLNSTGDEEETDESDDRVYDNSPDEETEDYSALTRHGDLNKNSVQGDRMDGNMPKAHATMEERLMSEWKQFMTEGVAEGSEFGAYYYEQLAQQTFDINPNLQDENEILNLGYKIAKGELGKRADGIFRNEDFPSDFVSAYGYLKKQGVAEGDSEAKYRVKSIGNKINPATGERCDFYVNPITNKEVFCKPGQKVSKGDHVTPSGTVKPKV
jgi:hypothetical protein